MALTAAPTTAYLHYGCGHAALVSLASIAGESRRDRGRRVEQEKREARSRPCDFCPPIEAAQATLSASELRVVVTTDTAEPHGHTEPPIDHQKSEDEHLTLSEPTTTDTDTTTDTAAIRSRSPLRKLSDEQELEVARLYRDTDTSVPQIARQFGIGESSVYRVSQKHGASTRTAAAGGKRDNGSRAASEPAASRTPASAGSSAPRRRRAGQTGRSATGQPSARRRTGRTGPTRSASPSSTRAAAATASSQSRSGIGPGSAAGRYRIAYTASVVVEAGSVKLALERAEAQGAIDIISIERAG